MSAEIAMPSSKSKTSALAVMADRMQVDPNKLLDTLKATVFKGASAEELLALVVVANAYNLNPLTKEIYAFAGKGGGIVPVISIDGWVNLANSHPQMDGIEFEWDHSPDGKLISCTSIIYRKDRSRPTRVTEYLAECRRNTEPWKMEHRMLRHKALCQGVRVAFGFSGVYDEDEARNVLDGQEREIAARERPVADVPALLRDGPVKQPAPTTTAPQAETIAPQAEQAQTTRQAAPVAKTAPPVVDVPEEKAPTMATMSELEKSPDLWEDEPPAEAKAVPEEQRSEAPPPADWRKVIIHIGDKTKGKTLGEIGMKTLGWFQTTWLPAALADTNTRNADDDALIAAIQASLQPAIR